MKKVILILVALIATVCAVSAQKLSGDITPLGKQQEVNVVLDFSGTLVNGKSEEKYIAEETGKKTESEQEQWLEEWNVKLRNDAYHMVVKDLDKAVGAKFFYAGAFPNAEYSIVIKVKEITTGFFAGIMAKPSSLKAEVSFVKTGNNTPIATVEYKKVSSTASANVPYYVSRIAMSFGTLGDEIAKTISKNLKK